MLALLGEALEHGFRLRCAFGTADETAAEHTCRVAVVRIEDAGLSGGDAAFAIDQLNPSFAALMMQDRRAGRARRPDLGVNLDTAFGNIRQGIIAQPVDVAQIDFAGLERLARTDNDARIARIEMHDIERIARRNTNAAALADRIMDNAFMAPEHTAIDMDDIAGVGGFRLQLGNNIGIFALRHKADVLAVLLIGNGQAEFLGNGAGFRLGQAAEREAQIIDLFLRGGEKEVALVLVGVDRTEEGAVGAPVAGFTWLRI